MPGIQMKLWVVIYNWSGGAQIDTVKERNPRQRPEGRTDPNELVYELKADVFPTLRATKSYSTSIKELTCPNTPFKNFA